MRTIMTAMEDDAPSPSHSELDAFRELGNRTEDPTLPPPLQLGKSPTLAAVGRKRTIEDVMNPSSDLPMFSSDNLSASLETYSSQNRKRQHVRRWWDNRRTSLSAEAGFAPSQRKRGRFTRNDDSGVWMNSDDAEPEMDEGFNSQAATSHDQSTFTCTSEIDMVGDNLECIIPPYWQHQPESMVDFYATQARASEVIQTALDRATETVDLS